jgi:hypothetical protein
MKEALTAKYGARIIIGDEINSFEFLSEHLYEQAKRGGYNKEFNELKTILPYLNRFADLKEMISLVESGDNKFRNHLMKNLIRLYQTRADLHPATIAISLIVLWIDLSNIYEALPEKQGYDERFANVYWHFLVIAGKIAPIEENITEKVIQYLKGKIL